MTEYEQAIIAREDISIQYLRQQTEILADVRSHTRTVVTVIAVLAGIVILGTMFSITAILS